VKTYQRLQGRLVAHGRTADNVGIAPQVLVDICSGVARHFPAVRTYDVWHPNSGDWQSDYIS